MLIYCTIFIFSSFLTRFQSSFQHFLHHRSDMSQDNFPFFRKIVHINQVNHPLKLYFILLENKYLYIIERNTQFQLYT